MFFYFHVKEIKCIFVSVRFLLEMRILFVFSGNKREGKDVFDFRTDKPFVHDQYLELVKNGIEVDLFPVVGKGFFGYLKNLPKLKKVLKAKSYDLVHAHYGLCGMLAVLQCRVPVVISFHGSDLHYFFSRCISRLAMFFSKYNFFVAEELMQKVHRKRNCSVLNIGVDLDLFYPQDKYECREKLNLEKNKIYALFGGAFNDKNKNYALAQEALKLVEQPIELIELKNYSRQEVVWLMNACDFLLFTSLKEGSPQVIKEAMACNCPIIATKAGDVERLLLNTRYSYVFEYDAGAIAKGISEIVRNKERSNGEDNIIALTWTLITKELIKKYKYILGNRI